MLFNVEETLVSLARGTRQALPSPGTVGQFISRLTIFPTPKTLLPALGATRPGPRDQVVVVNRVDQGHTGTARTMDSLYQTDLSNTPQDQQLHHSLLEALDLTHDASPHLAASAALELFLEIVLGLVLHK